MFAHDCQAARNSTACYGNPLPRYDRLSGFEGRDEIRSLAAITAELTESGYFFRPYAALDWQVDLRAAETPSTEDWGLTFVTRAWVERHLRATPWRLARHFIGRTGFRHDLYLLDNRKA